MQIPLNFNQPSPPEQVGMTSAGLARLKDTFDQHNQRGWNQAAQLVVARRGQVVFDATYGSFNQQAVTPNTPFLAFSAAKALTGICVHQLIESGQLEMDAPVAEYWPEFGQKGKATATLRHVFLHQAGIPARGLNRQSLVWPYWRLVTRNVANLPAEYPPGEKIAYHLVNYGFILGEVVRRVTSLPIEDYLKQEILTPLGMHNTWLRLPRRKLRESPKVSVAAEDQRHVVWVFNLRRTRLACLPAASLHSTARDLVVFYQMLLNGGAYAGRRYLQPETVQAATTLGAEGYDHIIEIPTRRAYGFHLGGLAPQPGKPGPTMGTRSTARTFGHFGNRSIMAWADHDAQLAVAFTTNTLLSNHDSRLRWKELSDAIWDALAG